MVSELAIYYTPPMYVMLDVKSGATPGTKICLNLIFDIYFCYLQVLEETNSCELN